MRGYAAGAGDRQRRDARSRPRPAARRRGRGSSRRTSRRGRGRCAARQPDRRHGRLGAGGDEADPLDRRARDDLLGQLDLGLGRGAVGRTAGDRAGHGRLHLGVRVAEQHRAPRADQVDVVVAVGVGEPGARGAR